MYDMIAYTLWGIDMIHEMQNGSIAQSLETC